MSERILKGYVGIPFLDHGRDRRGCDCWGLVRLVHLLEERIELPLHGEVSARELLEIARRVRAATASAVWVDVTDRPRQAMDVVLMKAAEAKGSRAWHLGIMRDPKTILHTEEGVDSHLMALDDDVWGRHRIVGFRRHWQLA